MLSSVRVCDISIRAYINCFTTITIIIIYKSHAALQNYQPLSDSCVTVAFGSEAARQRNAGAQLVGIQMCAVNVR